MIKKEPFVLEILIDGNYNENENENFKNSCLPKLSFIIYNSLLTLFSTHQAKTIAIVDKAPIKSQL